MGTQHSCYAHWLVPVQRNAQNSGKGVELLSSKATSHARNWRQKAAIGKRRRGRGEGRKKTCREGRFHSCQEGIDNLTPMAPIGSRQSLLHQNHCDNKLTPH